MLKLDFLKEYSSLHLKWLTPRIHPKSKLKTKFLFGEKVFCCSLSYFYLFIFKLVLLNRVSLKSKQCSKHNLKEWHTSRNLTLSLVA